MVNGSPETMELRARVRTWLSERAVPRSAEAPDVRRGHEDLDSARTWQRLKFAGGWAGLTWPKEFGGQGRPMIDQIVWDQEASSFDVPEEVFIVSTMLAGPTIIDVGTDEQRATHLPAILRGDEIWCQLFSEPGAGSDLAGVSSRAVRRDDAWVVSGQKVWSSGAHYADWGLLLARSDLTAPKHAGMSMFLVDMRTPGVTVRPIRQITGAQHFNEVFLDEVVIPDSGRIGLPGDGWKVALITLQHERLGLISRRRVELDALRKLVMQSRRDGCKAMEDDFVRQEFADIWMRADALQLLAERTLRIIAQGGVPGAEGSIGKLGGAQLLNRMGRFATDLLGPAVMLDSPDAPECGRWQFEFLDATARRIAGGSDEIQRNIIAERILGLPRGAAAVRESTRGGDPS